jgi:putative endonuclease
MNNIEKGSYGEDVVVGYLIEQGYRILERNYRYRHREVDIIALQNDVLVFVEVKTRSSHDFGYGFESVRKNKQHNILSVAQHFIQSHGMQDHNVRFDVASIDGEKLQYIERAF